MFCKDRHNPISPACARRTRTITLVPPPFPPPPTAEKVFSNHSHFRILKIKDLCLLTHVCIHSLRCLRACIMCARTYVRGHVEVRGQHRGLPHSLPILFFVTDVTESLTEPGAHRFCWTVCPASSSLCHSGARVTGECRQAQGLFVGVLRDQTRGRHFTH